MTYFVDEMKADKWWRLIDAIGHITFALVMPGHFWFQWLPDILVPYLLWHGFRTGGWLPESSLVIRQHRLMHSMTLPVTWLALAVIGQWCFSWRMPVWFYTLVAQWAVHVLWDQITHQREWQKRSLWR